MKQSVLFKTTVLGLAALAASVAADAQTFTRDDVTYELISRTDKTCKVTTVAATAPTTLVISDSIAFGGVNYGVVQIGPNAFDAAVNLATLTLPSTLKVIDQAAFFKPTKLRNLTCLAVTPPDITSSPFATTIYTNCTLHVPDGTWLAYSMDWRRFNRVYETGAGTDNVVDGIKFRTLSLTSKYVGVTGNSPKYSGDVKIPAEVEIAGTKYSVVEIGVSAFDGCNELSSVTLPETILGINDYAFRKATIKTLGLPNSLMFIHQGAFNAMPDLEELTIPSKITRIENIVFQNSPKLKTITFPSALTFLGPSTFAGCTGLTDVKGGENLTFISSGCFNGATSLTGFTFSENVDSIETQAFKGTGITFTEVPKKVRVLCSYVFQDCYNLKNITMGDQIVEFGSNVFSGCSKLETVRMSNNIVKMSSNTFLKDSLLREVKWEKIPLTTLPSYTFSGCVSLESFTIPEGVEIIGNGFFQGCESLTEIKLPSTLTGIAINGFYNSGLKEIIVPEGVNQMGTRVFANCASLTKAVLPKSLTVVSQSTFGNCTSLTDVTLGEDVTQIMPQVFQACEALKTVTIPAKVTEIGKQAFYGCKALEEIQFPDSVKKIDTKCFTGCEALKKVISLPTVPPTIVDDTFDQTTYDNATLCVQEGAGILEAYREATGWKLFKKEQVSIEEIAAEAAEDIRGGYGEIIAPEGAMVYTLQGVASPTKGLVPGLYIVRVGTTVKKVIVK